MVNINQTVVLHLNFGHSPGNIQYDLPSANALEHFDGILVGQIMAHHSINSQNLVALKQIPTFSRLTVVHNSLHENPQSTSWTVIAADNRKAQTLLAGSLLKHHCVECVRMALLQTVQSVPLPGNRTEVLRQSLLRRVGRWCITTIDLDDRCSVNADVVVRHGFIRAVTADEV